MEIAFAVTSRCNASCLHCATSCGPNRTDALPTDDIKRMMSEAAAIDDGQPLRVHFTGGEVFLDFEQLLDLTRYGAALGAEVGCVSNGYWATSDATAMDRMTQMKSAGLTFIAISTSRFHQAFVSLQRIRRALRAAEAAGVQTELKVQITTNEESDKSASLQWIEQVDARLTYRSPILPHLREGAVLPEQDYVRLEGLPDGKCPGHNLSVAEDGMAYTCGTAGSGTAFLAVGHTGSMPIASLNRLMRRGGKQHLLMTRGPIHFAQAAVAAGHGNRLRTGYSSACDLCLHIAHDPVMSSFSQDICDQHDIQRLRNVFGLDEITPAPNSDSLLDACSTHQTTS